MKECDEPNKQPREKLLSGSLSPQSPNDGSLQLGQRHYLRLDSGDKGYHCRGIYMLRLCSLHCKLKQGSPTPRGADQATEQEVSE